MKRYEHYLFPSKGNRCPSAIVAIDVEVNVERIAPGPAVEHESLKRWMAQSAVRIGNIWGKSQIWESIDPDGFWALLYRLCQKRGSVWVICPNASQVWPLIGLWDRLERGLVALSGVDPRQPRSASVVGGRQRTGLLVLEEPVNAAQVRFPDLPGICTFVDARNYGVDLHDRQQPIGERVSRAFLFLGGICEAISAGKMGSLAITAAGQSLSTYRRRFIRDAIFAHSDKKGLDIEGRSYFGGRCEAFRLGEMPCPVYLLDYSSLYAWCCTQEHVPTRYICTVEGGGENTTCPMHLGDVRIADVTLTTNETNYPYASGDLTIYPTGTFRTVLAGPELQLAERRKHVLEYHATAWYHEAPALRSYAQTFLSARDWARKHNYKDIESWLKRLLVSLPGKFGQRGKWWEDTDEFKGDKLYETFWAIDRSGQRCRYRTIAGIVQKQIEVPWAPDAVPSIAAWITSAARVRLLEAIETAGKEEVFYCDTDSIITSRSGYERCCRAGLVGYGEPGLLRLEIGPADCTIHGWKSYNCGGKVVRSGVPRGGQSTDSPPGYYWWRQGIDAALKMGQSPRADRRLMRHYDHRKYQHGVIGDNGVVRPFILPDEMALLKGTKRV